MTHKTLDREKTTELGSHPVGTGVGAAVGGIAGAAATGAVAGSSVGPAGTIVGALAGAVVGGLAGKGIADLIDPAAEEQYWRDTYTDRPYVTPGLTYDDYGPAYRYGIDSYDRYEGRPFDTIEPALERDWERAKGTSKLTWEHAKHASRDAWQRVSDTVERAVPGDSDRDGK